MPRIPKQSSVRRECTQPEFETPLAPGTSTSAPVCGGNQSHLESERRLHTAIVKCIDFFLGICNDFMNRTDPKITTSANIYKQIDAFIGAMNPEGAKMLFEELVRKIDEEQFLYCSFCDRCMFIARHTFMHIGSKKHKSKLANVSQDLLHVNNLLIKMAGETRVQQMFKQATERVKNLQRKWSSMRLSDPELRPRREFMEMHNPFLRPDPKMSKAENANYLMRLMGGDVNIVGRTSMKKLFTTEIGNGKARCIPCKLFFANADEYYDHLTTYFHLANVDSLEIYTILINMHKRDEARLEPWPEMPDANA